MTERVRGRARFVALDRTPLRCRNGAVGVRFVPHGAGAPAVAFALSRRVGNAVTRNRLRRRLRAAVRELESTMSGGDYLVSATADAVALDGDRLVDELAGAVRAVQDRRR